MNERNRGPFNGLDHAAIKPVRFADEERADVLAFLLIRGEQEAINDRAVYFDLLLRIRAGEHVGSAAKEPA